MLNAWGLENVQFNQSAIKTITNTEQTMIQDSKGEKKQVLTPMFLLKGA